MMEMFYLLAPSNTAATGHTWLSSAKTWPCNLGMEMQQVLNGADLNFKMTASGQWTTQVEKTVAVRNNKLDEQTATWID